MYNEKDEQVIFIKDLVFTALYRWRMILVFALVAALLLGGFAVLTGQSDQGGSPISVTNLQAEYLKNSALMNLDPHRVGRATANISILAEAFSAEGSNALSSYVGALLNGYASTISNLLGKEEASTALGLSTTDLMDLVSVTTTINGIADGVLVVQVYHNELAKAEEILTYILDTIPATTEELTASVANHTINTVTASGLRMDLSLLERQAKTKKTMEESRVSLNKWFVAESVTEAVSTKALVKKGILWGVIGAVAGLFMAVCVIWVSHFSSTKVYSARTLTAWTGIKVLGCAEGTAPKCAFDRWLRKLEGRANEKALPVTAGIVANYAASNADFLICADPACPEAVQKLFSQKIPTAKLCGTIIDDIAAVEALPGCDAVLLVAVCGKTRYSEVARQMQLIHDQGKTLVGCVVIGG
ncbi:MAG: hypothetical protein J6Q54_03415 [Oscillospiraceae bacterium]|nr:hypothetical protein [Oscillospiraceae bacterium]